MPELPTPDTQFHVCLGLTHKAFLKIKRKKKKEGPGVVAHTSNHSAPETEADMDLCLCSEVQADLGYAEKTKNKMKIQGSTRHQQLSLLTVLQPTSSFLSC